MQRSKTTIAAVLSALVLMAGCASTPEHESFGQNIDDSVITTKIKALYVEDSTVKAHRVNVETYKGVVQLSGFVSNQREADQAVMIARNVKGVREVKNDIQLRPLAAN